MLRVHTHTHTHGVFAGPGLRTTFALSDFFLKVMCKLFCFTVWFSSPEGHLKAALAVRFLRQWKDSPTFTHDFTQVSPGLRCTRLCTSRSHFHPNTALSQAPVWQKKLLQHHSQCCTGAASTNTCASKGLSSLTPGRALDGLSYFMMGFSCYGFAGMFIT